MIVQVVNFGDDKVVPTCQGDIHIPHFPGPTEMDLQKKAAQEINEQPEIEVTFPEANYLETELEDKQIDYSGYRINELRSMAAVQKIKGSFTMKKAVLIQKLEEKNAAKR